MSDPTYYIFISFLSTMFARIVEGIGVIIFVMVVLIIAVVNEIFGEAIFLFVMHAFEAL